MSDLMKEKVVKLCKCIFLFCVLFAQSGHAEEEVTKERKLKAAYVLNFIKYMSWPVNSGAHNEFRLCVHSDEPFYQFMQALVARHNQGANKVQIVIGHTLQEPLCHLAYFQSSIEQSLGQLRRAVVVLESLDVKQVHAAIRFYTQAQKVRFEFDIAQLAKIDVIASSELLKLARIIR
ncbi:YfiR family protein [Paraglaciecola agarilytica]|uniref:YfiR family protein n=1 Tax=Paraglaciecola chathamensis TaxID=368405 RepID=UPI0023566017|nr:YfiR family protein [Paraglaciecola agarilytica]